MQIAYIGLGKMGKNMVLRLLEKGHDVYAWNRSEEPRLEVKKAGAKVFESIEVLVQKLPAPRTIWLMLPAGSVTQDMVRQLSELLSSGDVIIDGANSFYKDAQEHVDLLSSKGIDFIDVGVSGGPAGARNGACLMVGATQTLFEKYESLYQDLAADQAFAHFEGVGAGHFVKMVHNGIEYGMMQAIGEGFEVMKKSNFNLDLQAVAGVYSQQSVIASRLISWLESGYKKHGIDLADISGSVKHSGEGQWTVETAKELAVPVKVIEDALQFRIDSTNKPSYTGKVVSVLRNEFGGHKVGK